MRAPIDVLFLSHADIVACAIGVADVTEAVRNAFAAKARGRAATGRQLAFPVDANLDFKAKGGVLHDAGLAAVKWYGFAGQNAERGLPNFIPVIVVNSLPTGIPVAIMDGHWISGVRTAALTAVAAIALANPRSSSIGFIAGGLQAETHLAALMPHFPLKRLVVYSRRGRSAALFAEHARALGIASRTCEDPRDAISNHDIVVTCIPRLSPHARFLDAAWVSPGAFVSMVDAGMSWNASTLGGFDLMMTDYLDPATRRSTEALNYDGAFDGDLSDVVSGSVLRKPDGRSRFGMVFGGSGLADVAVAALVYERAVAAGIGQKLQL